MTMSCDQVREQLEAYAIGALEPHEARAIDGHLSGCAECRAAADELAIVANLLPLALSEVVPMPAPATLKSRVLGAITGIANEQDRDSVRSMHDVVRDPVVGEPIIRQVIASEPGSIKSRYWNLRTVAAAAAAILLVVSLVLGVRLSQALDREQEMQVQIRDVFTRQQEVVLEVVDSDQTQRMVLRPLEGGSTAYGKVFTRSDLPHVVAMAARLPPPPDGMGYHLWLTRNATTALAGVLMLNDQGFGLLTFDADTDGPIYDAAVLTLQESGDDSPAGETVLAWPGPDA